MFMSRHKKSKSSFKKDEQDRTILGSAKEMAIWVIINMFFEKNVGCANC